MEPKRSQNKPKGLQSESKYPKVRPKVSQVGPQASKVSQKASKLSPKASKTSLKPPQSKLKSNSTVDPSSTNKVTRTMILQRQFNQIASSPQSVALWWGAGGRGEAFRYLFGS